MPVEDVNYVAITEDFLQTPESVSGLTEFWSLNADLIAIFVVIFILLGIFIGMLFITRAIAKKVLNR